MQRRLDGSFYRLRLNPDISAPDVNDEDTDEQAEEESSVGGGLREERRRGGGLFAHNRRAQRGVDGQMYEKAAVKFKPQLHITNGCHAYPAVDEAGQTGGGLKIKGAPSAGCKGSGWGSQVYGRSGWYQDVWAIMYSWYFPKDEPSSGIGHRHEWEPVIVWINNPDVENPKILAVTPSAHSGYHTYAPPNAGTVDGSTTKVAYESHWPMDHALDSTSEAGDFQDLIMWDQLTENARRALNSVNFGSANTPMNDGNFQSKLGRAWPFSS
ncbi:hypothetical protein PF008_g17027 [Phytophthora fragariae]|uniref:Uncharacterized protein n=1 Tax=Phytophthora fragariae TaxID=53985 RepID=A0A6G0RAM0_9STRA|nr:hypothetical protein PF008_g17027 [Phytophthora fragariae]